MFKRIKKWFVGKFYAAKKVGSGEISDLGEVPAHYSIAKAYLGTKEIPGKRHNQKIRNFFKVVVGKFYGDETPWCAAFVGYCLDRANSPHTGSLGARSYERYGHKVIVPMIGDIVVLWRGKRSGWAGHVGFYAGETRNSIIVLGGNQNNEVSYSKYPRKRLLGYRRP